MRYFWRSGKEARRLGCCRFQCRNAILESFRQKWRNGRSGQAQAGLGGRGRLDGGIDASPGDLDGGLAHDVEGIDGRVEGRPEGHVGVLLGGRGLEVGPRPPRGEVVRTEGRGAECRGGSRSQCAGAGSASEGEGKGEE